MSQRNIEVKSNNVMSHDDKEIDSYQHSKNKKEIAEQLRNDIRKLRKQQQ